jgi:hypothetical protein
MTQTLTPRFAESTVAPEPDGLTEKALLPATAYSDPEFFAHEQHNIFDRVHSGVRWRLAVATRGAAGA